MALLAARSDPAISYNPDFLNDEAIDRLLALRLPEELPAAEVVGLLDVFKRPAFERGDAKALYDDGATRVALDQALSLLLEDPDYQREIEKGGKEALVEKSAANLRAELTAGFIDQTVAANNQAARDSVRIVEEDGKIALKVDETILVTADPTLLRGASLALILQIAAVFLDIFALLCTAIGIAIEHGSGWIKRIAEYIKGFGQAMVDWATGLLGKAGAWLSELRSAHGTPQWLESVKTYAKQIANLVVDAMKSGWRNRRFINTVRYAFGRLFAGHWYEKAYYLLQLIGGIILLIGTAGASVALKIALAIIQRGILVWDSVLLADMLRSKRLQAA